jgi:hypothetical protein
MGSWCDRLSGFREEHVHRIAEGWDRSRALALFRADSTEDAGRCGSLISRGARASAALEPPAAYLVLLADTSFVLEPNFYLADVDRVFARYFIEAGWKRFLRLRWVPRLPHDDEVVPRACGSPSREAPGSASVWRP